MSFMKKKETTKPKENTSHHSPKELGEDQPPPVQPERTKTLQLKRLRERQKTQPGGDSSQEVQFWGVAM
jgi:hypothetical protein